MPSCQQNANFTGMPTSWEVCKVPDRANNTSKPRWYILISNGFLFRTWRVYFQNVLRAGSN